MKLQEFYYILGQKASNGKSAIFEALTDIMPCYVKRIESNTFEIKKSQLHKEIATWKGIRIGWANELSKNKQDAELIKNVADGTAIKYKVMYGISIQWRLHLSYLLLVIIVLQWIVIKA